MERLASLLATAIALCGCGALLPTSAEQRGDCTLVLRHGDGRIMEAPYRFSPDDRGDERPIDVVYEADGWGFTTIATTDPAGRRTIAGMDRNAFNRGMYRWDFDLPGTWHVRLSDRDGCLRSFAIEFTP